jgi:hypothetical protein
MSDPLPPTIETIKEELPGLALVTVILFLLGLLGSWVDSL